MNLVLLAGGKSRRMKRNKLFLPFDQEETLLAYMLHRLNKHFQQILIVTNAEYQPRIQKIVNLGWYSSISVILDSIPFCGPLVGIYSGLMTMNTLEAFFLAADQPFFSIPLIRYMSDKLESNDAVVPKTEKGFEPLFAIYSKKCVPKIKMMLDNQEFKVSNLLEKIKAFILQTEEIKRFDPGLLSFINVNTETDYRLLNPTFTP